MRRSILALLAIIVLIFFGIIIFGGSNKTSRPVPTIPKTLPDYAETNAEVSLTTDGRINGDDVHRAIRITVSREQRSIDIIQGYEGYIIKNESFANSQTAYDVFLRSLNVAGFTRERKATTTDERGVCPLGNRYIFELNNTGGSDMRRWSTSCSGLGTFGGKVNLIRTLFQRQITDYNKFINGVNL